MAPALPLLRVCQLLNEAGARYLVRGAQASKETYREQDAVDRRRLQVLKETQQARAAYDCFTEQRAG